jgi:hypothetical protein
MTRVQVYEVIEYDDSHQIEAWTDHVECLRCGLNSSIGDEGERLALPCTP